MKYWRGYLVAAILATISWSLMGLAKKFTVLVDMVYPYVSRMIQNFLVVWSNGTDLLLWQVGIVVLALALMTSIVLMILLRWNPIQWGGWVLAAIASIYLMHTCLYGLNVYAGPIADDIRLEVTEYTLEELVEATTYYRDKANALAKEMPRDEAGNLVTSDFDTLAQQAGEGFEVLTYQHSYSVFAGDRTPVKKLGWADMYSSRGTAGVTVALTGEAAVNPQTPRVAMPFTMCHEMAHRMCIAVEQDANFAAYLACEANSDKLFQYSAYFMAYYDCYSALASIGSPSAAAAAARVQSGANTQLAKDLEAYTQFVEDKREKQDETCELLVSWHIQTVILPAQREEATSTFDPYDESQVDLSGIVGALPKEEP